jgi:hypothetical protein
MRTLLICTLGLGACWKPDIQDRGFACNADEDIPPCPEGFECRGGLCQVSQGPGIHIEKAVSYTGMRSPAGLDTVDECPDYIVSPSIEPNDGINMGPVRLSYKLDMEPTRAPGLAICPVGNAPWSGAHDVDYYKVDTSKEMDAGHSMLTLKAEIDYDIQYGDLDIAVLDATGGVLNEDGSAMSGGCSAAQITPGVNYIVVVGAGDVDVNRYTLKVKVSTTPENCFQVPEMPMDGGT